MKKLKQKLARATACHYKLNRKILKIKKSWDQVEGMLNQSVKRKTCTKDRKTL